MKILAIITTAILASTMPALADNNHRGGPPPRRMAMHQRYHEGQNWRGHRLTNRNGHWGYFQPRNGANVFISIPL
jgi:hypothetical protein